MKANVNRAYNWLERNPATSALVSAGVSGIAVLAVISLAVYSNQTFVQKTPCTKDATSAACAKIREEVARAEPIRNPCISYQRVTATRGRNCPRRFVRHRQEAKHRLSSTPSAELGGDALQPASAGQQPVPGKPDHGSKPSGHHHSPPHHGPHSPPPSTPPPSPAASQPSTPQPGPPPPAAPGNSGETPAAEHGEGVKACVNLVVGACAEASAPKLLP